MDCTHARDILARVTLRRDVPLEPELEEAIRHAEGCAACQRRLQALARGVLSERPDEMPCSEARDHFLEYRAASRNAPRLFSSVHWHLAACAGCRAELRSLVEMLALADEEPAVAAGARRFDIGFVRGPEALWERLEGGVSRLGRAVAIRLQRAGAEFEDLAALLGRGAQQPATALRGPAEGVPVTRALVLPDDAHDADIHLALGAEGDRAATLFVAVQPRGADHLVTETRALLQDEARRLLEQQSAMDRRMFVFGRLMPGVYWLELQYEGRRWEICVPISAR